MHPTQPLPDVATRPAPAAGQRPSRVASQALALKQAAQAGALPALLRGKHIGLVCPDPEGPEAAAFASAMSELGAQVSSLNPEVASLLMEHNAEATAQWLGRLYHAIECQSLAPAVVERVRRHAGVPVFEPGSRVECAPAELLEGLDPAEARRRMLQAAVVVALE